MKGSILNDAFFSRLETLSLELRANLGGFFGGKHLVRTYGQTVECFYLIEKLSTTTDAAKT